MNETRLGLTRVNGGVERKRSGRRWILLLVPALLVPGLLVAFGGEPASAQSAPDAGVGGGWEFRTAVTWLELEPDKPSSVGVEFTMVGVRPLVWRLLPIGGVLTSSSGQGYAYAGLGIRVSLGSRLRLAPSISAGAYNEGLNGTRLGSPLEFRSSLAIDVRLSGRTTVSFFLYHLSNAGLGARNPGLEALGLGLSLPLRLR